MQTPAASDDPDWRRVPFNFPKNHSGCSAVFTIAPQTTCYQVKLRGREFLFRHPYFFASLILIYSIVFPGDDIPGRFIQSLYASVTLVSLPGSMAAAVISTKY